MGYEETPQQRLWGFLISHFGKGGRVIFKINKVYLKIPRRLCGGEFSFSCSSFQNMRSEASDLFFEVEIDKTVEVLIFDGFKLSPIDSNTKFIKKKLPVTEGNYFILFFIKEGYAPKVKVLWVGKENIKLGKIRFEKMIDKGIGFLTGVVYKPIRGGKISYRKGILKLFKGVVIKIISDKGVSHLIKSGDKGLFSIPLAAGKYKIFIDDNQKVFDVLIKDGKTNIQNLQKGIMLID